MKSVTIIHNPRCSKSRAAIEILNSKGIEPKVIDYLNGGLTENLLKQIISALGKRPKDIVRTKEEEFLSLNLNLENDQDVFEAILKHPKILERPIVVSGDMAVIGRPPDNILQLF